MIVSATFLITCRLPPNRRFRCHINVEICSSITAAKYLHSYFYKGPDKAQVRHYYALACPLLLLLLTACGEITDDSG
jgi:hypothetical protein